MSVSSIMVGQLSDGSLQLFASTGGEFYNSWKESVDSSASWTKWSSFDQNDFGGIGQGSAPRLLTGDAIGELQLFTLAQQLSEVDVTGGPDVGTTWKLSFDPNAGWSDWEIFYAATKGPPGSPNSGISSVAAAPLSDSRIQVFMMEIGQSGAPTRLMTSWQQVPAGWVNAQPFTPQPSETLSSLTAGALSDGRLQLWGSGTSGIWTTWKESSDPNSAWSEWSLFQSFQSAIRYRPTTALSVGRLPDGRLQLWASAQEDDLPNG